MSLKLKRVLYALALGLVFAVFCTITEAGTPQANVDGPTGQIVLEAQ